MRNLARSFVLSAALAAALAAAASCTRSSAPAASVDSVASARPRVAADAYPAPSRPVASIISPAWSDEAQRDDADEADEVFRLLGVHGGMRVADIGAGSGYYTVRLSRAVGPTGWVYAEDIMPDYLTALQARVTRERLANVQVVTGAPHDPRLPDDSVDLALLVHMYHEIEQPFALLANLRSSLRPGARVAVLDLDRPTGSHGTPPRLLECEFGVAGYRQASFTNLANDNGYLAVFVADTTVRRSPSDCR